MEDRTWVYRLYDTDGRLLYVGMSRNVGERIRAHRLNQPWGHTVTRWTYEAFPTRYEASVAERDAISTELPRYNIVGRPRLCERCAALLP